MSSLVTVPIVSLMSLTIVGCTDEDVQAYCVIRAENGELVKVDDDYCEKHGHSTVYHYIYGGQLNNGRVYGGSTIRPKGVNIVNGRGTVVQRGGFGGRGFGGS